ncbi:MAG: aquaporin [bacterium]|nr:aquaporin [bacterium]
MLQIFLAEFIATFTLIFIGAGSVLAGGGLVAIALAHGFAILVMVYTVGHISGAHMNPAVTIALWARKKLAGDLIALYIGAQLGGAIIAAFALRMLAPAAFIASLGGTPMLSAQTSFLQGMVIEAVLTFLLVFVVFTITAEKHSAKNLSGIVIGLVIAMNILFGGPFTGAAMNPARALGPAVASGAWSGHLLWWLGPILGALGGAFLYAYFEKKKGFFS